MTNMTQHEKILLLEDYIAELGRFPADIIATACRAYCLGTENEFFPKAAKLIAACVGKYSVLAKRRRIIVEALEEGKRLKERRLSEAELRGMTARLMDTPTEPKTMRDKIADTLEMLRKTGASQTDIDEFIKSQEQAA